MKGIEQANFPWRGALIGGGGITGALLGSVYFLGLSPSALLTLAVGGLAVSVVVFLVLVYLRRRLRKFYGEGDRSLMEVIRGRPAGVSDPEQLARLDGFARKFEEGCTKYVEATGMSVSESPWYLLVGESGSGKTEAIRRCGVEFPEGLHEERQGAGGTTNMDWWFTEQAIILDTAGRFAIDPSGAAPPAAGEEDDDDDAEESASADRERRARASTEREWQLFLERVVKARPHCPVNGLVLTIPATSLLKDSKDQVNNKGMELARFLNGVRQSLGVRFPVFVLVTKSDLIPGFREFFGHIRDPELAQQMLGWSKSGSLDEPFDLEEIDAYLDRVRHKLERRRLSLIADPVHSQLPGARRIEQVDALYTFPDRFAELAPQLRRYLGKMFVRSKFNQNPLFLRGIYFTSSMEQGAAIDAALASLRGVSLKQLERDGVGYRRDRAVFLRDVFMQKVFVETGLVTRETHTDNIRRRRQLWTMGAVAVAALVLMAFGLLGKLTILRNIGPARQQWADVAATYDPARWNLLRPSSGRAPASVQWDSSSGVAGDKTITAFLERQRDRKQAAINTPLIYKPVAFMLGSPEAERQRTVDALIQRHLLGNVLDTARARIRMVSGEINGARGHELSGDAFTKDGAMTQAAVQLKRLADQGKAGAKFTGTPPEMARLLDLCLQSFESKTPPTTGPTVEQVRRWLSDADVAARVKKLSVDPSAADEAARLVGSYWSIRLGEKAAERRLPPLAKMKDALSRWEAAFNTVRQTVPPKLVESQGEAESRLGVIRNQFNVMKAAADEADAAWRDLRGATDTKDVQPILAWLSRELTADKNSAIEAIAEAMRATETAAVRTELDNTSATITKKSFDPAAIVESSQLKGFRYWARCVNAPAVGGAAARQEPLYREITDALELALAPIGEGGPTAGGSVATALKRADERGQDLADRIGALVWVTADATDERKSPNAEFAPAQSLYETVSAPKYRHELVSEWLARAPRIAQAFETQVAADSSRDPVKPVVVPLAADVPSDSGTMSGWERVANFNPTAAATLLGDWVVVNALLEGRPTTQPEPAADGAPAPAPAPARAGPAVIERESLRNQAQPGRKAAAEYGQSYVSFWFDRRAKARTWTKWSGEGGLDPDLTLVTAGDLAAKIDARSKQCVAAIDAVAASLDAAGQTAAADAITNLKRAAVSPPATDTYAKWEELPTNALAAVGALTAQDAKTQYNAYLAAFTKDQGQDFHRDLALAAMRLLAGEARELKTKKFTELETKWLQRFPFNARFVETKVRNREQEIVNKPLTAPELAEAAEELKEAVGSAKSVAAVPGAPAEDLSFIKDDDLRDAYTTLRDSAGAVQRLLAARDLANVLTDPKVTCEFYVLKAGEDLSGIYIGNKSSAARGRPDPVPPAAAKNKPFVMPPAGGELLIKYQWKSFGRPNTLTNPLPKNDPCMMMQLLVRSKDFRAAEKKFLWPAAGREMEVTWNDKPGEILELTLKVVFKRDGNPIDVPFPIPDPEK